MVYFVDKIYLKSSDENITRQIFTLAQNKSGKHYCQVRKILSENRFCKYVALQPDECNVVMV